MPARADQTLELAAAERTFRLVFQWQADRWQHFISEIATDGGETVLLQSVEGTSSDVWPLSPALQDLSIEHRSDGSVALAVGMSGKSNFSAAVTSFRDPDAVGWEFDLACRAKESPAWLGSTYQLPASIIGKQFPTQRRETADSGLVLSGIGIGLQTITSGAVCKSELEDAFTWKIVPAPFDERFPQTVCWKYRVTIALRTQD